jgi:hypothetical protein
MQCAVLLLFSCALLNEEKKCTVLRHRFYLTICLPNLSVYNIFTLLGLVQLFLSHACRFDGIENKL